MNRKIKKFREGLKTLRATTDDLSSVIEGFDLLIQKSGHLINSICRALWQLRWVAAAVCFFHLNDGNMSVYLRGFYRGVTHHALYQSYVAPVFKELGGEGVPEQVTAPLFPDVGLLDQSMDFGTQAIGGHSLSGGADEQSTGSVLNTKHFLFP
jgi:hypothetical protein